MASLDSNIVTVALPRISHDFSAGFSFLAWVVTGYLVALIALVILFGKMADVYGRKKIYIAGFIFFGTSSALCGLSQNIIELVVFRVIQGCSAALFFAVSRPILLDNFPANEISFAFGVNTATSSIGAVAGPVIGGFLVAIDWRLIFYVNVPIAIIASLLAIRNIPPGVKRASTKVALQSFNPLDSALFIVSVSLIMIGLTFYNVLLGALGLALIIPLVISERRSKTPLVNRELTSNRGFVYAVLAVNLLTIGYSGITFAMTFYFQSVLNLQPSFTGILIAPVSLTIGIGSVATGRIYGRMRDPNRLANLGAVLCGLALIVIASAVAFEASLWIIEAALAVAGVAVGLYWIPLLTTAMKFPRQEIIGTTSGTFSMFVNMTSAVSIAVTVSIAAAFLPHALASQVYSGGLVNLSTVDANLFKMGIEYSLIVLGIFNLSSIPLIFVVTKEQRAVRQRTETDGSATTT